MLIATLLLLCQLFQGFYGMQGLTLNQLSKDEEAAAPDAEVTREDQDKINAFSRLHNREKKYEEELEHKQVCSCFGTNTYH